MATFTAEELEFIKQRGNDECAKTWLGLWDPKRAIKQEQREFMIDKYEQKRLVDSCVKINKSKKRTNCEITCVASFKEIQPKIVIILRRKLTFKKLVLSTSCIFRSLLWLHLSLPFALIETIP